MKSIIYIILILTAGATQAQTLEEYQQMAAENNPGLKATHKAFEAALEQVSQASGLQDPNLTVSAFGQMIETRVGPQKARFSLSQMFPWFGTLKAQGHLAALMAESKYQAFLDERNRLYYQVAAAYYPLYELNAFKTIEADNIRLLESYKAIATAKFSSGSGTMVDVLRVDIMLQSANTRLTILDKEEASLKTTFNNLLNRDIGENIVVIDSLAVDDALTADDSLPATHPRIAELELKIEGSQAAEYAARKQGLPKLGVGLDYIIVGERTDFAAGAAPPADNGKDAIMPMVSVSLPVFRKKYRAAVKEAQLMQESYAFQKQATVNALATDYEVTRFELAQQRELIGLYEGQSTQTDRMLELLFTAYSNSEADFEEVLATEQQLLQYRKMKVEAAAAYQVALAKLYYVTAKVY
ncbi:TolC family protein [uncultured Imperialibacter sp.]|uniref:TolC family protein n=1 Tax=uncultured Imperialibacter sp. TaxID=1672639 RepID=UPI0030D779B6|tara:strand:- start:21399 stop:22634 length:1236 start_codon:yes stop_codon:yes gene_type:complete